jgi:hypothetical protein
MRALLLGLASATALLAEADALEIIPLAVAADERNWKVARNYGFLERVDARRLDSQRRLKSKDVKIYDVMLVEGSPYRRLAGRDDRPLPPGDEKKEQDKLARSIAERRKQTPAQRALRLAAYESRPEWQREAWHELPEAFDFRLAGEETWDGNSLYVISATPVPGIPAPVPHGESAYAPAGQTLGGQAGLPLGESGGGSGRHHLSGIVSGPPGQGLTRGP